MVRVEVQILPCKEPQDQMAAQREVVHRRTFQAREPVAAAAFLVLLAPQAVLLFLDVQVAAVVVENRPLLYILTEHQEVHHATL